MGLLDRLKKKEEYANPFAGINFAIEQMVMPEGAAIETLSELKDREIRAMTMVAALNMLFKQQLGKEHDTVLDIFEKKYLLLKMGRNRRRIRELVTIIKASRGSAQVPIYLRPIKRIAHITEEGGEE